MKTSLPRMALIVLAFGLLSAVTPSTVSAADDHLMEIGEGHLTLTAPAEWVRKQPRTNIVEHEFAVPHTEGDSHDGRLTVMGAAGTIEANIDRWPGQFAQADGSNTTDVTKLEEKEIGGVKVHLVSITGIYSDMPAGPFAQGKVIERDDYRMLGAIIVGGKEIGTYFVKLTGPRETIDANEAAFRKMVDSLTKK